MLAIVLALAAGVAWAVLFGSWFRVTGYEVRGVDGLLAREVGARAEGLIGESLATANLGGVQREVGALRPVRQVQVKRSWPHSVRLTVTPRRPVLGLRDDRGTQWVDATGLVYPSLGELPSSLPILTLAPRTPMPPSARAIVAAVGALGPDAGYDIDQVRVSADGRLSLRLAGVRIDWGDAAAAQRKVAAIRSMQEMARREGRVLRAVDVSNPARAVVQ